MNDEYYAAMEQHAMEQAQSYGEDFEPELCPRTHHGDCPLCRLVGVKWDEPYLSKSRAGQFKRENGDPIDYEELKGILWVKSRENGNPTGPTKDQKQYARLWRAREEFYSPVIMLPRWDQILFLQYGPEIWRFLNTAQFGENQDYADFWDPMKGTNVVIKKTNEGRIAYSCSFRRDPSQVPNAKMILQQIGNSDFKNAVQHRLARDMDFARPHKLILDNTEKEFRFLPWLWTQHGFSKLFFIRAYYHFPPSTNDLQEVGGEAITKGMIEAAIKGEYDPFGNQTMVQVPAGAPPAAPQVAPMNSGEGLTSGPSVPQPPTTGTPLPEPTQVVLAPPMTAESFPVPTFPQEPVTDIDSLLRDEKDVPISPQGPPVPGIPGTPVPTPVETPPGDKHCFGTLYTEGDQFCSVCQYQAQCKTACGK